MKPQHSVFSSLALGLAALSLFASAQASADPVTPTDPALTPEQQRAQLNQQVADRARAQMDENAQLTGDALRAYNEAVAAREATIRREREAYQARQAEYEAAMARWRADVAACKAGDHARCAQPAAGQ